MDWSPSLSGTHRHDAAVAQVLKWLKQAFASRGNRKPVLAVGRDGLMLPIRGEASYREGATATLAVPDRRGKRLGTIDLDRMPEPGQEMLSRQLTDLIKDVLRQWTGPLPRLAYITDGDTIRPSISAGFSSGAAAIRRRRIVIGDKRKQYKNAYNYLRKRIRFLDYHEYRRNHLPIGSGVTEAACKTVFTQRLKQSGMTWSLEGGQRIVDPRVIQLSGLWPQVYQAYLQAKILPEAG
ncbi:MAG: hypothetical protein ACP5XB_30930 [Isosphaeraceae bacterium]